MAPITDEQIERACELISDGDSLRTAAQKIGAAKSTLDDVLMKPQHAGRYARAREQRAATLAERALEVVENVELDPADKRVRLDAYKWFSARLDPQRWSEKQQHEISAPGGGPLQIAHSIDLSQLSAEERAALAPVLARIAGADGA